MTGFRLNSSSVRHVSRTASAAPTAPSAAAPARVLAQVVESIRVDGRVLGARGHDDEVAIPRLQTLEPGEELVPLGSTLRATHPLLGVAGRKVERVDESLLTFAGFLAALVSRAEQHARGGSRVEGRLEVRGARRGDESVASRGRVGVEQAACSVESPRRRARQHAHLLLAALGRLRGDPLPHRALREAAERNELAAGEDRRRQRAELAGDEHDHRIRRAAPPGP